MNGEVVRTQYQNLELPHNNDAHCSGKQSIELTEWD